MIFSLSYFAYDMISMQLDGLLDSTMLLHHPLSMLGFIVPLYQNVQGNYIMLAVWLTEISNPPMHMRHIFRSMGKRYTMAYEISEILYITLYIYGRAICVLPIGYLTFICPENSVLIKISCAALTL